MFYQMKIWMDMSMDISPELIKKYSQEDLKYYYLCGPPPMMEAVEGHLASLGIAEQFIVKEGF